MNDNHPPTVVERYRRHLDSPYGRELHDLAEVEILACELRELVALAERAPAELPAVADEFAGLRAFCATWLAELEQHGWLSRRLLLADGSELNVAELARALDRLAKLEPSR
jgi:hypothetical protein